jgi:hypothetical protein
VLVAGKVQFAGSPADLLDRSDFGDLMLGQVT